MPADPTPAGSPVRILMYTPARPLSMPEELLIAAWCGRPKPLEVVVVVEPDDAGGGRGR